MVSLPTASKLQLWLACPASVLGQPGPMDPSDETKLGLAYHSVVERITNFGWWSTDADSLMRTSLAKYGLDKTWVPQLSRMDPAGMAAKIIKEHPTVQAEVAYGYHVPDNKILTGLGASIDRNYPPADGVIYGTADLVWTECCPDSTDLCAVILDLKTGPRAKTNVPPASQNAQLKFLAMCAMAATNAVEAKAGLAFVSDDGWVEYDWYVFSGSDLDLFRFDIEDAWTVAETRVDGGISAGPHCTGLYCPRAGTCGASTQLMVKMGAASGCYTQAPSEPEFALAVSSPDEITSPEHASWLLARWQLLRRCMDAVEHSLKAYAEKTPIAVDDAKEWGPSTSNRIKISGRPDGTGESLNTVLERLCPGAVPLVDKSLRKEDLARVVREDPEHAQWSVADVNTAVDQIVEELITLGLAQRTSVTKYDARRKQ